MNQLSVAPVRKADGRGSGDVGLYRDASLSFRPIGRADAGSNRHTWSSHVLRA